LPNSVATDRDYVLIAGHYSFAHPEVIEIKKEASAFLKMKDIDLDVCLKTCVKKSIMRYLKNFKIVRIP
jgi:hypothetical protein